MSENEIVFCTDYDYGYDEETYTGFIVEAAVLLLALSSSVERGKVTHKEARAEWSRSGYNIRYKLRTRGGAGTFPIVGRDVDFDALPGSGEFIDAALGLGLPKVGIVSSLMFDEFLVLGRETLDQVRDRLKPRYDIVPLTFDEYQRCQRGAADALLVIEEARQDLHLADGEQEVRHERD